MNQSVNVERHEPPHRNGNNDANVMATISNETDPRTTIRVLDVSQDAHRYRQVIPDPSIPWIECHGMRLTPDQATDLARRLTCAVDIIRETTHLSGI